MERVASQMSLKKRENKMRTITITAVALVAALSARATGFNELTLQTNDWFDVSMASVDVGTDINQGDTTGTTPGDGSWTAVPKNGTATNATDNTFNFIALSSDFNEPLTFTPAPFAVTSGYETVVATIKSDAGDELPKVTGSAQAAFTAIVTNGTLTAFGLTANGWTNLVYDSVANLTNDWFTIYMDFANGEGSTRYVRYSVQPNNGSVAVLTDNTGASWFSTTNSPTITSISFSGVGKVQTFSGDELTEPITFGTVEVEFLANYQTATTVVATVSGTVATDTIFTLTANGKNYTGDRDGNRVTFYNVILANEFALGGTVDYTLSANSENHYTGTVASVPQSTTVGNQSDDWILENSSHQSTSGAWTNSANVEVKLEYNGTPAAAALNNHLFTPTNAVGDAIVTVTSDVCFGDVADLEMSNPTDSYAAIRLADDSGTTTFQIWAKETENDDAHWFNVSNGQEVNKEISHVVESKFDFVNGTCSFKVGNRDLANNTTNVFYLANGVRKMSAIKFNGVGTLTQLSGSYVAAGYTEEVGTGTNVTVSSKWVAENLPSGTTIEQARAMLNPESDVKKTHGNSEYNYFECYALGIDPDEKNDAPIITATPDGTGKFGMKLEGINVPEGVTLTVTLKAGATPDNLFEIAERTATAVGTPEGTTTSGSITFDPANDMTDSNVKYLKMDISIGATP